MLIQFAHSDSNFMFSAVPIFIAIVFIIVFGLLIFTAIKGVSVWSMNNRSPQETKQAFVLTKRTQNRHVGSNHHHNSTTQYYITFELSSGSRMELQVQGKDYGLLAEGDKGTVHYQGTRFLDFTREASSEE
ncbi:DUF2500 domain-containing protein [Jeotgalibacillus proteolyticus]|uniref:DUF2500 domain-containing protein n=2 Tax=Jeotgalibacillus proteolyticus TaxID=2082395 RepID=A0A2S5GAL4_9BACL|nr:DUF2500 domain-containing protein [Jeotgalibacillus proteolyticus]